MFHRPELYGKVSGSVLVSASSSYLTFIKEPLELCKTVSSAGFHDREGQQYCQQCFLTLFASRCQGCSQPILENYISALNSLWHPQCFVCRVSVSLWGLRAGSMILYVAFCKQSV